LPKVELGSSEPEYSSLAFMYRVRKNPRHARTSPTSSGARHPFSVD
jgi:hypothetical protein